VLVLTRRPHQSIHIGDDIVVTVLEVKGDQIRIGISAPRDVQVVLPATLAQHAFEEEHIVGVVLHQEDG